MITEAVARLISTSSLAGTRSGLTLFALALAARFGVLEAPQEWMVSNVGLGLLLALVVLEELAEQDEDLQQIVDLFAYALRAGAGALAASTLQSAGLEELPAWAAALIGAALATATHHLRAKLHEQVQGVADSVLSPRTWLAWIELGGTLGLLAAVVLAPIIALGFVILAAALAVLALVLRRAGENRMFRRDCPQCATRARVEASRCPKCRAPLAVERWLGALLIAGLGLGASACKPSPPDAPKAAAVEPGQPRARAEGSGGAPASCAAQSPAGVHALVPNMAEWLVSLEPGPVLDSRLWALLVELGEFAQGSEDIVATFEGCGVPIDSIERVVVGFNRAENFIAAFAAPKVAQPEVASCVILEIQALVGEEQAAEVTTMAEDPSQAIIEFTDGRAYLFDDVFVLVTTAWEDEVYGLSRCAQRPAIAGALAELFATVDEAAPLWIIGEASGELGESTAEELGFGEAVPRDLSVGVRFESSTQLVARSRFDGPEQAELAAGRVRAVLAEVPTSPEPELAALAGRVSVERVGAHLQLGLALEVADFELLVRILGQAATAEAEAGQP